MTHMLMCTHEEGVLGVWGCVKPVCVEIFVEPFKITIYSFQRWSVAYF